MESGSRALVGDIRSTTQKSDVYMNGGHRNAETGGNKK